MRAWHQTTFGALSTQSALSHLGALVTGGGHAGFAMQHTAQVRAWETELDVLEKARGAILSARCEAFNWPLLFEVEIPRRQKRIDAVILTPGPILVIEFKVGATSFDRASRWQVEDYALDLKDFHAGSHNSTLVPILVATDAEDSTVTDPRDAVDNRVICTNASGLGSVILDAVTSRYGSLLAPLNVRDWLDSGYKPSLTIVEAAEHLFGKHSVREISHAYADNLGATCVALVEAIVTAQREGRRLVCFVTGVPGSGKTLAGLSAVHDPGLRQEGRPPAVFLSGNGPLVKIVRAALTRDCKRRGESPREAERRVNTFIQNVHEFIKEHGQSGSPLPPEHVVVFDEAQRAWDALQVESKRGIAKSEAELMLEIMGRLPGWSVVVALVGNGQEIHKGEAGLEEWGRALRRWGGHWEAVVSPEVLPGGTSAFQLAPGGLKGLEVSADSRLHLEVSVRSPRAQRVADWVDCVLSGRLSEARQIIGQVEGFPIVLTRSLDEARAWLRDRARDDRRPGLVASSGARRLRAYGLELSTGFRHGYSYEDWFLGDAGDIRSSHNLEVVASQFECQGLELDWVGVCWGGDLTMRPHRDDWLYREFRGTRWQRVNQTQKRVFLLNRYRVLLTRAREGMVIWFPPGKEDDPTLEPALFDATADHLEAAGVPMLGPRT